MAKWQPREIQEGLEKAATSVAEELGFDLVEARYIDGARRARVRIFIDSDPGVSLEDCAHFSRSMGARLDLLELIPKSYDLEVASPGLDRPFSTLRQYARSVGRDVVIDLKEPIGKEWTIRGVLAAVDEGSATVTTAQGAVQVPLDRVRKACRAITFGGHKGGR